MIKNYEDYRKNSWLVSLPKSDRILVEELFSKADNFSLLIHMHARAYISIKDIFYLSHFLISDTTWNRILVSRVILEAMDAETIRKALQVMRRVRKRLSSEWECANHIIKKRYGFMFHNQEIQFRESWFNPINYYGNFTHY